MKTWIIAGLLSIAFATSADAQSEEDYEYWAEQMKVPILCYTLVSIDDQAVPVLVLNDGSYRCIEGTEMFGGSLSDYDDVYKGEITIKPSPNEERFYTLDEEGRVIITDGNGNLIKRYGPN